MTPGGHICLWTGTIFGRAQLDIKRNNLDKFKKIRPVVSEEMR